MKPEDYDNLKFLLTAPDETIQHWLSQADSDDLQYAETLMKMYQYEIIDMAVEASDCQQAVDLLSDIKVKK